MIENNNEKLDIKAQYHLPGLFEFYDFYSVFLLLFNEHREYFYDWCEIGSIYGAPADCLWGGGRVGFGDCEAEDVLKLVNGYGISARLTFSNLLLTREHLNDKKCNELCKLFDGRTLQKNLNSDVNPSGQKRTKTGSLNGIIISSDILLDYLRSNYPDFYFISSTTKVITDFNLFEEEVNRREYRYVVPDFRLNKEFDKLRLMTQEQKDKVEFLCNECCYEKCTDRKDCYENVSRKALGEVCPDHICASPYASRGYQFSRAMVTRMFISVDDIKNVYMPMGFTNFKIEGRSLGSAMILEFILHYMTKPEYQLRVREEIYLDSMLDLF